MSHDVTDFQAEVIERSRTLPVLVDFWAAWCGPCRVLGPLLEHLAGEAGDRWALAKVDTEKFPELAGQYGVTSIPSVKLFAGGEVVDEFVGALPEADIRRWIDAALPSPLAARVAEARGLVAGRAYRSAAETLREVLAAELASCSRRRCCTPTRPPWPRRWPASSTSPRSATASRPCARWPVWPHSWSARRSCRKLR
jgi:putative thioredoxin